jgi:hypothetical protein
MQNRSLPVIRTNHLGHSIIECVVKNRDHPAYERVKEKTSRFVPRRLCFSPGNRNNRSRSGLTGPWRSCASSGNRNNGRNQMASSAKHPSRACLIASACLAAFAAQPLWAQSACKN